MIIDIKHTKVYLISPGHGKYRQRLHTVFMRLVDQGYTNIEFFRSVVDFSGTNSLTRTVLEIFKKELTGDRPFIILEDDCQVLYDTPTISCPDDADALYLGVSQWIYPHAYDTLGRGFHIRENTAIDCIDMYPTVTRIKGMTGTHAILYISREYIRRFIHLMNPLLEKTIPHDLVFATMHPSYNIYALKEPMYYQDGTLGGQEGVTKLAYKGESYVPA
jgi:hypothetical protein